MQSLVILDEEGKRVAVKYYDTFKNSRESQFRFEQNLCKKSSHLSCKGDVELLVLEEYLAVHKASHDLRFYIIASHAENELIAVSVLETLYEALHNLLRGVVDRQTVLENLDLVLLAIDELVDGGLILETDPDIIVSRVAMTDDGIEQSLTEQTITQALATAREQLSRNLLR